MKKRPEIENDPWRGLRKYTGARVALGRAGHALPTGPLLDFRAGHAMARDAVHIPLDAEKTARQIAGLTGAEVMMLASAAADRNEYLLRPDLGRVLNAASREKLSSPRPSSHDIAIVVADGLSSTAIERQCLPFLSALLPHLKKAAFSLAPVCVATQGRVAIGDEIGSLLGAALSVVCIGERPGLSSPDSMGVYMTYGPRKGNTDARRNCISNIRPEGLPPEAAAAKLLYLIKESFRKNLSGVHLKDEQPAELEHRKEGGMLSFPDEEKGE